MGTHTTSALGPHRALVSSRAFARRPAITTRTRRPPASRPARSVSPRTRPIHEPPPVRDRDRHVVVVVISNRRLIGVDRNREVAREGLAGTAHQRRPAPRARGPGPPPACCRSGTETSPPPPRGPRRRRTTRGPVLGDPRARKQTVAAWSSSSVTGQAGRKTVRSKPKTSSALGASCKSSNPSTQFCAPVWKSNIRAASTLHVDATNGVAMQVQYHGPRHTGFSYTAGETAISSWPHGITSGEPRTTLEKQPSGCLGVRQPRRARPASIQNPRRE